MDLDELEIFIEDEVIPIPGPLEHPSVARIKESVGIPVKKYRPIRVKSVENKPDVIQIVECENSSKTKTNISPIKVAFSEYDLQTGGRHVENMSLDEVIQLRKEEFDQPKRVTDMSLSEIIQKKQHQQHGKGALESKNANKRLKNDENGGSDFKEEEGRIDSDMECDGEDDSARKIPRRGFTERKESLRSEFKVPRVPRTAVRTIKYTPDGVLRILAEQGFLIVFEVSQMKDESHARFSKHRWRACYYEGRDEKMEIKGIGEAPRKALAKQCAALDFIEKFRMVHPELKVPECKIPDGVRISPFVLIALENVCNKIGVSNPSFTEDLVIIKGREKYKFTIHIRDQLFYDISYDSKYAKYKAAKKAYDAINPDGREFYYDPIVKGEDCVKDVEYVLVDSEELHIVHSNKRFPRRVGNVEKLELSMSVPSSPVPGETGGGSGRSSPASTCSSTTRRILVSAVAESILRPRLARIRRSIQKRKLGVISVNSNLDATIVKNEHQTDPQLANKPVPRMRNLASSVLIEGSMMDTNFGIDTKPEANRRSPIEITIDDDDDDASPCTEENSSAPRVSFSDPRLRQKQDKARVQPSYLSAEYIRQNWSSEIRTKVLDQMNNFRFAVCLQDEALTIKDEVDNQEQVPAPNKSRFCVMTFNGFGASNSFKMANVQAKESLLGCINQTKKAILADRADSAFPNTDVSGSSSSHDVKPATSKRSNPFYR